MKKIILVGALMLSVSAQANNDRRRAEARAIKLSAQINQQVRTQVDTLRRDELRSLVQSLRTAKNILDRIVRPTPPAPRPFPPRPLPPVPRPTIYCSQEMPQVYQATFRKMKTFYYSSAGLNMSTSQAMVAAQDFANKYQCTDADKYITIIKRLKNFGYSSQYRNLSSSQAIAFAVEKVNSFCESVDIEGQYSRDYQFAYSSTGMNMSASQARKYAYRQVEQQAFSCRPFDDFMNRPY